MSEEQEKKPKIDLKARLGRKAIAAPVGGPAIPPPVGIPAPVAFSGPGGDAPVPGAPKVDGSDPYAAVEAAQAPARAVEQQSIKIEMSDEVMEAQAKTKKNYLIFGAVGALVGALVGFAWGGGSARGEQHEHAIAGAGQLVQEVDAANIKVTELSDVLKSIFKSLQNNKYPEAEVSKLAELDVPFEGSNLNGKGIGNFNKTALGLLLKYANAAEAVNDEKDQIRRILNHQKKRINGYLSQKKDPAIRWAVFVTSGPKGPWAQMQPLPEPFVVKSDKKVKDKDGKESDYDWPAEFKIKEGKKVHDLKRYKKGDPLSGSSPVIIPVAPETEAKVCSNDAMSKLRGKVMAIQKHLRGDQTPGREREGLVTIGEKLLEALKKIELAGAG
ncbi:MAG: hypothetical protein HRU17_18310 [Polyangiaceae bacterium]|nr:hypothetical protein [Polyangiaceae bacterium]